MTLPLNDPRANVFVSIVVDMTKQAGGEPAHRLLSLSKISFRIPNENIKKMQRCSSLPFFFLINK